MKNAHILLQITLFCSISLWNDLSVRVVTYDWTVVFCLIILLLFGFVLFVLLCCVVSCCVVFWLFCFVVLCCVLVCFVLLCCVLVCFVFLLVCLPWTKDDIILHIYSPKNP